jgi:hypothetical protein
MWRTTVYSDLAVRPLYTLDNVVAFLLWFKDQSVNDSMPRFNLTPKGLRVFLLETAS